MSATLGDFINHHWFLNPGSITDDQIHSLLIVDVGSKYISVRNMISNCYVKVF